MVGWTKWINKEEKKRMDQSMWYEGRTDGWMHTWINDRMDNEMDGIMDE